MEAFSSAVAVCGLQEFDCSADKEAAFSREVLFGNGQNYSWKTPPSLAEGSLIFCRQGHLYLISNQQSQFSKTSLLAVKGLYHHSKRKKFTLKLSS